ncbi:hypothetical protein [Propionivibrio sp.]|uniref:hypothetical protein n=1 Tax=Propionivibrio sp. TaxID=2212460 RepID=UPI003BF02303
MSPSTHVAISDIGKVKCFIKFALDELDLELDKLTLKDDENAKKSSSERASIFRKIAALENIRDSL